MADGECGNCARLEAEVRHLEAQVRRLKEEVRLWRTYAVWLETRLKRLRWWAREQLGKARAKMRAGGLAPAEYNRVRGVEQVLKVVLRTIGRV